jgi:2-aminomuconate deaminase
MQCRAVFENVRTVLEDAGSAWEKIVDVTVFLTNMKDDFAVFNKLYAEYFAGDGKPNPTRTTVEVNCLPTPIAIELKVIAIV